MATVKTRTATMEWIDLEPFGSGYMVWAGERGSVIVGTISYDGGGYYELTPDKVLPFDDLASAVEEMASRRKDNTEGMPEYGEPISIGGGTQWDENLWLERPTQHEYRLYATCGEAIEVGLGELRAIIEAIRVLPVAKGFGR